MRVVLSPIFWGLLIGSMAVNAWILINFSGQRELVEKSVKAWEDLGLPVVENTAEQYLKVLEPGEKKEVGIPTLRQIMDGTVHMTNELNGSDLAENFSSVLMKTGQRNMRRKNIKSWMVSWQKIGGIRLPHTSLSREAEVFLNYFQDGFLWLVRWKAFWQAFSLCCIVSVNHYRQGRHTLSIHLKWEENARIKGGGQRYLPDSLLRLSYGE